MFVFSPFDKFVKIVPGDKRDAHFGSLSQRTAELVSATLLHE